VRITTSGLPKWSLSWAPDGSRLVFTKWGTCYGTAGCAFAIRTVTADGTNGTVFTDSCRADVAWSPDGTTFAGRIRDSADLCGAGDLFTIHVDKTNEHNVCCPGAGPPNWAPDQSALAFAYHTCDTCPLQLVTARPDGSGITPIRDNVGGSWDPAWSPDGTKIAYIDASTGPNTAIRITGANGVGDDPLTDSSSVNTQPDWQPIPQSYVRPKGATPFETYLVPAYKPCTASNRSHGAPLAYGSCNPPQQASDHLTLGTPDANGQSAQGLGSVFLGGPRSGDALVGIALRDIRNKSDLSDYPGEVQLLLQLRITDRNNTPNPGGPGPGTMQDTTLAMAVPCTATVSTSIGSDCTLSTTVDALYPGAITAGQRSIWQLGQVQVYDGGASGVPGSSDATLFLDEGVFIP
jgi:hypothetical protein